MGDFRPQSIQRIINRCMYTNHLTFSPQQIVCLLLTRAETIHRHTGIPRLRRYRYIPRYAWGNNDTIRYISELETNRIWNISYRYIPMKRANSAQTHSRALIKEADIVVVTHCTCAHTIVVEFAQRNCADFQEVRVFPIGWGSGSRRTSFHTGQFDCLTRMCTATNRAHV